MPEPIDADALCAGYLAEAQALMRAILEDERDALDRAADKVADQIAADRLVHIYGPAAIPIGVAGDLLPRRGLMHVSAILDEGTLLSGGALRSMAIERTPGYGRVVIADWGWERAIFLILANAYGINAALIDAAIEARARGVFLIGFSSRRHAERTAPDHPARHPTKQNLHDLVDVAIDTKVEIGDALVSVPGLSERIVRRIDLRQRLRAQQSHHPHSGKACGARRRAAGLALGQCAGGDAANARFVGRFRHRVRTAVRPERVVGRDPSGSGGLAVTIERGRIAAVEQLAVADGPYLAPGLIDLQVNGYRGRDLNDGHWRPIVFRPWPATSSPLASRPSLPTDPDHRLARVDPRELESHRRGTAGAGPALARRNDPWRPCRRALHRGGGRSARRPSARACPAT